MVDRRLYDALPSPRGPYVHSVRHSGTLYVSGLTALDTAAQGGDLGQLPACSLVQVAGFIHPDLKVEIEGIIAI